MPRTAGVARQIFISAEKQFGKSETWKAFSEMLDKIMVSYQRVKGVSDTMLHETGALKLGKATRDEIPKIIEETAEAKDAAIVGVVSKVKNHFAITGKAYKDLSANVQDVSFELTDNGGIKRVIKQRKFGLIPKFFPRELKHEVAEPVYNDIEYVFGAATKRGAEAFRDPRTGKILNLGETSQVLLEEEFDKLLKMEKGLSEETKRQYAHVMDRIKAKSPELARPSVALEIMYNRAYSTMFGSPIGSFKHGRKTLESLFTRDAYESDFVKVIKGYNHRFAKRMAEAEIFGVDRSKLNELILRMPREEAKRAELLVNIWSGSAEAAANRNWRSFQRVYSDFSVTSKIGLGYAIIPNMFQWGISTLPKVGIARTLRAAASLFDAGTRKAISQSGFVKHQGFINSVYSGNLADAMRIGTFDMEGLRAYERVSRTISGVVGGPFGCVNKMLNIISAAQGKIYVEDLYKIVNRQGGMPMRKLWAKNQLKQLGIDFTKPLNAKQKLNGMIKFANESQLQHTLTRVPVWMNNPNYRVFGLFKRFGYLQSKYVKDRIIKDEIQCLGEGKFLNLMPLMRITAAGAGTGYLSYKAKQFIDRNLFDKPEEIGDDEKEFLEELFTYWGTAGAFGNISDMARLRPGTWTGIQKGGARKDYAKAVGDLVGSGYFAITPLLASDIHGLPGNYAKPGWLKIFKDLLEKSVAEGIPKAWQQEKYVVMRQTSPLLSTYAQGKKAKEEARKKTIQAMIKARSKK